MARISAPFWFASAMMPFTSSVVMDAINYRRRSRRREGVRKVYQEEQAMLEDLRIRDSREAHLKKFALTLLQQCKGENLTMKELDSVINTIRYYADRTTLRDGLTLQCTHQNGG